ncbi:hypothetical protein [Nocardia sp. NPDC058705]|uniref:hypothetical protein n=1 Tax=Nocardia sp. NPDC058705 TaxID=3346609 RepID=UPI0036A62FA2
MTGREKPSPTQWGVPGGGENTHSWRHREIVAAFTPLEVTDAVAQAELFEQIARWWDEGLRAFQDAVGESLAQAWSSAGGSAARSAVDAHIAQARELGVALEKLPEVVRSAAEAIVATKYAIPPLVAAEVGASTRVVDAVSATGHGTGSVLSTGSMTHIAGSALSAGNMAYNTGSALSVSGMLQDVGSAAEHGASSAAEEDARAQMRRRYVMPFGELIDRIPLLPMPTRCFGAVGEAGDRRLSSDEAGRSTGERRGPAAVDSDGSAEVGPIGSGAVGEDSALADSADAVSAGLGVHGTEDPPPGADTFADDAVKPDRELTEPDGGEAEPDREATSFDGDATALSADLDGGAVEEASEHGGGTVPASAPPDRAIAAGVAQPGSATAVTSTPIGATGAMASPGGTGISGPAGAGSVTPVWGNSAAAIDPSTTSAGRSASTSPYTGLSSPAAGIWGTGDRTSDGGSRYHASGPNDAQRPGVAHGGPGTAGSVIGANPSAAHTAGRLVDRYFHCVGAAPTTCSPGEDAARDLPEYLITLANGEELLGRQRPAVAGGVIGGEDDGLPGA